MYLKVGSYQFDANATGLTTSTDLLLNGYGRPLSKQVKLTVDGFLAASGQAAISTAMDALTAALHTPFQDIIFYHDDATESALYLKNNGSISGVRVTRGPVWLEYRGADHATQKKFMFEAAAEYPTAGSANLLMRYTERLEFEGGGPLYIVRPAKRGPAQRQQVYQSTPYIVTQIGEAVGYTAYPPKPLIIWPGKLKQAPKEVMTTPERVGPNGYQGHTRSWSVVYESEVPLIGTPHLWV